MCVTTRKERENGRPKALLSSEINFTQMQTYFLNNPQKTDDDKYAYDIIQKAYWINEKKIEMLDFNKHKKLLKNYHRFLTKERRTNEKNIN